MLSFQNVIKTFVSQNDVWTLGPLNFEVKKGEFVVVLGQSGSGKSTLLHLAGGLVRPDQGEVIVAGQSLYQISDQALTSYRNQKMGFIFQDFYLLEDLNIFTNVALPLLIQGGFNSHFIQSKVINILQKVGLEDLAQRYPSQLSGGQKQRVAIARAFVAQPKLIFADEPTGNLDETTGKQILDLLKRLNKTEGVTLVCVTHDTKIAQAAQKILELKNGKLLI